MMSEITEMEISVSSRNPRKYSFGAACASSKVWIQCRWAPLRPQHCVRQRPSSDCAEKRDTIWYDDWLKTGAQRLRTAFRNDHRLVTRSSWDFGILLTRERWFALPPRHGTNVRCFTFQACGNLSRAWCSSTATHPRASQWRWRPLKRKVNFVSLV